MSERWKYQLKIGLFWGLFMTLFNILFELQEKTIQEQLASSNFYLRAVVFTVTGIFLLGYMNWKSRQNQLKKK